MKIPMELHVPPALVFGVAVFIICCLMHPVEATAGLMVITMDDGQQDLYELTELKRIYFENEEMRVVDEYGTHSYPLQSIARVNLMDYPTDVEDYDDAAEMIKAVNLFQNHPNPFNPETRIDFELPKRGMVKLCIYAVTGRLIRTLINEGLPSGPHSVRWNGRDDSGRLVASGAYFYSLATPEGRESRKMILLR